MIAAVYARKSTDQNGVADEEKSVARQVERARAYALKKGWTVLSRYVFADDGISGAEFERRPGLMALMATLKPRPPFQVLIMSNVDRLGREQIETTYLLKQIIVAGVRVFDYMEDRERVLDSPTDKLLLSVTTYAAEMERHQARQRTRDALLSKALRGYVTGGAVFGYRNVEVLGDGAKRQHVVREIDPEQAEIVRRIFTLAAEGSGFKRIAAHLNREGVPSPRPRRSGRPRSWTSSSVRGVLLNPLYRGHVVWGRIRKRDSWGLKKYLDRPENEWVKLDAEHLRIVSDELWDAAARRIASTRLAQGHDAGRRAGGRPIGATGSRYLLTGFAQCEVCGGGLVVGSQDLKRHGRRPVYGCSYHRERGNAVCVNRLVAPIEIADRAVLAAIEGDVMRVEVVDTALEEALDTLRLSGADIADRRRTLDVELAELEQEIARYARAVAEVGPLPSLLGELRQRETRRDHLTAQLRTLAGATSIAALDPSHVRRNLRERLTDWQGLLRRETPVARQILREVLVGRLIFGPRIDGSARYYEFTGQATLSGLLAGVLSPERLVTPAGFEPAISTLKGSRPGPG